MYDTDTYYCLAAHIIITNLAILSTYIILLRTVPNELHVVAQHIGVNMTSLVSLVSFLHSAPFDGPKTPGNHHFQM